MSGDQKDAAALYEKIAGGDPDDPYGDRKFVAERGGAKAKPRAARKTKITTESDEGGDAPPAGDSKKAGGGDPIELLRRQVMDLDRVDLDRVVAQEGELARGEFDIKWTPDENGLPPHCPVIPLGKKSNVFYFLTPDKELLELGAGNFGQQHIDALFAPQSNYLVAMWGATGKANAKRVKYEAVRRALMDACGRRGVFDPADRVRGRGAWKGETGSLIVHFGDRVSIGGAMEAPGVYEGYVYPARPKMPAPIGDGKTEARAAARQLLEALKCWRWARGELDARLMLGWMMVALLGAAVDWRPQVMLTGDAGTGKSTLQALVKNVLRERLVDVADATAAALFQTLGHDALAVGFDEFENEDDAKGAAVMRLARLASSGGRVARGGADGVPTNYQARGAFLFSAINPPALRPAEQTRIAILALRALDRDAKPPNLSAEEAAKIGQALAQRVATTWGFWGERLEQMRARLMALKHSARGQDQYGTLLAAADLALQDDGMTRDEFDEIADAIAPDALSETAAQVPNWRACLNHVMGAHPDAWRSERWKQIGQALSAYADRDRHYDEDETKPWTKLKLRQWLALAGLSLVQSKEGERDVDWLGFPARSQELAKLFANTDWSARRGADGAWMNALSQAPEGMWKRDRFRVGGGRLNGILVRLDLILDVEKEEESEDGNE